MVRLDRVVAFVVGIVVLGVIVSSGDDKHTSTTQASAVPVSTSTTIGMPTFSSPPPPPTSGTPKYKPLAPVTWRSMVDETGCNSQYSDERKLDLYRTKYDEHPMTVVGKIETLDKGKVELKVNPNTLTFDVMVTMRDPSVTYNLLKGTLVTMTFTVSYHGGCFLSYSGRDGVIIEQ